jgi:hypothetical protein
MQKVTLLKHFTKLCTFLFSLVFFVFLTLSSAHAKLDSDENKKDKSEKAAAKVMRHMEKMEKKFPKIQGKKKEVEEELSNGSLTPFGACSRCHVMEQQAP